MAADDTLGRVRRYCWALHRQSIDQGVGSLIPAAEVADYILGLIDGPADE